jgi:hypothetical protein
MRMDWLEELDEDFRFRNQEQSRADALRLHRAELIKDQAPSLFERLKTQVKSGITSLGQRHPELKSIAFESSRPDVFSVRNSDLDAAVKITARLHTRIIVIIETRQSAAESFVERGSHWIEFGLDDRDKLSLCLNCLPLGIDDVAKLILRPALGIL